MILNNAKNMMLGSKQIERVYCGEKLVWGLQIGWGRKVFDGTEIIDIPGSAIEGFSAFRFLALTVIAKDPYICNEFPYHDGFYRSASKRCVTRYAAGGGQVFFIVPDTEIPHNDTAAFKVWLKMRYDSGNPIILDYVLK